MGNVLISIKIMPNSPEVNLEDVVTKIKENVEIKDYKIEPMAFGLKILKILVMTPDKGGTDEIEGLINEIDGVESVEVENVTLA
ncbi:MAG: elongation factor 1-beta [Candidatus Aenigmarchaeota archaeon]|nr:elongation factor 1-beta [Candidatus Aenigmarchaeota archaeon]